MPSSVRRHPHRTVKYSNLTVCSAFFLCIFGGLLNQSHAQDTNLLLGEQVEFSNCGEDKRRNFLLKYLTDDNPNTLWRDVWAPYSCELTFRFQDVKTIKRFEIVDTYQPTGFVNNNPQSRITVWASHQSFGNAFFKLKRIKFQPKSTMEIVFDKPIKLRSLKVLVDYLGGTGMDARIAEIRAFGPASEAKGFVWPQPPMTPLKRDADPLVQGAATQCDSMAGFPFSPDSYGHSRVDSEIDVVTATQACELAAAEQPQSARSEVQFGQSGIAVGEGRQGHWRG